MTLAFEPVPVPLTANEQGEVRVKGTRVPLQYLVYEYRNGATAEDIVSGYPTLKLADVHAVLSYYLAHKAEVDEYVREQEQKADEVREKIEGRFPQKGIRERLLARLEHRPQ